MSTPETVTYTVTVEIKDADGKPIREGSVLRHIKDTKDRGVVTTIIRAGDKVRCVLPPCIGDLHIKFTGVLCGVTRVTNQYSKWRHVPHNEQTYEERLLSWKLRPYDHDEDRKVSKDEGLCIDGIMALLPEDIVNWEQGPWPDTIDDALEFLAAYLTELKPKSP